MTTNSYYDNKKALERIFFHSKSPFNLSWEKKKNQSWNYLQIQKEKQRNEKSK